MSKAKGFLIGFLVVGAIGAVVVGTTSNWFTDWSKYKAAGDNVASWVNGGTSSSSGSAASATTQTSQSSDGSTKLVADGLHLGFKSLISKGVHTQITVTANVYGKINGQLVVATNHTVAWSFAWTDTNVTLDKSLYFKIVSTADTETGGTCLIEALKAYSGTITLTATNSEGVKATLPFDCYNSVSSVTFSAPSSTAPYSNFKCALDGKFHDFAAPTAVGGGYACTVTKIFRLSMTFSTDGGGNSNVLKEIADVSTTASADQSLGTESAGTTAIKELVKGLTDDFEVVHAETFGGGVGIYIDVLTKTTGTTVWCPALTIDGSDYNASGWTVTPYIPASSVQASANTTTL